MGFIWTKALLDFAEAHLSTPGKPEIMNGAYFIRLPAWRHDNAKALLSVRIIGFEGSVEIRSQDKLIHMVYF